MPAALLMASLILVYAPALRGGFLWDDNKYVSENPLLTKPGGLGKIWFSTESPSQYFPLTYTAFWLARRLWGLNTLGYHLLNVILHGANALLLWRLLSVLGVSGAFWGAAVFALHPLQVESVAWITELKNILSAFFALCFFLIWHAPVRGEKRSFARYLSSLAFFLAALAAKTTTVTLTVTLILIAWWRREKMDRRWWLGWTPFAGVGFGMGLVTMWWERFHQGTGSNIYDLSLLDRLLVASRAVWSQTERVIWPAGLSFSYPRWAVDAGDWRQYVWPAALAAAVFLVWKLAPARRGTAAAFGHYAASLAPLVGFIPLYTFRYAFVADHYQYLALAGPAALAGALPATRRGRTGKTVSAGLCLILGLLSFFQARLYRDPETLWRGTIAAAPRSWLAHNNLGRILEDQGNTEEAMERYREALRLNPDLPEAWTNLGNIESARGNRAAAGEAYRRALAADPGYHAALFNMALTLAESGEIAAAESYFRRALEARPRWARARGTFAAFLEAQGRLEEASREYRRSLEDAPDSLILLQTLAAFNLRTGRAEESLALWRRALADRPGHGPLALAAARFMDGMGRRDEALSVVEGFLRYDADNREARLLRERLRNRPTANIPQAGVPFPRP